MKLENGQTIVFFGDSITRGHFGSSYLAALRRLFTDRRVPGDYEFVNAGRDGDMIDDLLKRVNRDVLPHEPDWVVVLVGINDIIYESLLMVSMPVDSPARRSSAYEHMIGPFKENYGTLIDILKEHVPNVAICTTTLVEGDIGVGAQEKLALLNDTIRALADEKHCWLIDLSSSFRDELVRLREEEPAQEFTLTVDGVHLSRKGARLAAETMFEFFVSD